MRTRHRDQGLAGYTTDREIRTYRERREETDDDPMYYVKLIAGMTLLIIAFVIIPAAIVAMALDPGSAWMF